MPEICSKFTKKLPEPQELRGLDVFIVNLDQISHIVLVFRLWTCKKVNADSESTKTNPTQSAFTCSKLALETLEQGVKYVQS